MFFFTWVYYEAAAASFEFMSGEPDRGVEVANDIQPRCSQSVVLQHCPQVRLFPSVTHELGTQFLQEAPISVPTLFSFVAAVSKQGRNRFRKKPRFTSKENRAAGATAKCYERRQRDWIFHVHAFLAVSFREQPDRFVTLIVRGLELFNQARRAFMVTHTCYSPRALSIPLASAVACLLIMFLTRTIRGDRDSAPGRRDRNRTRSRTMGDEQWVAAGTSQPRVAGWLSAEWT